MPRLSILFFSLLLCLLYMFFTYRYYTMFIFPCMSWYSLCQIPFIFSGMSHLLSHNLCSLACHIYYHTQFIFSGMSHLLSRTVYILWHVTSIITHSSYSLACHIYYHTQFIFSGMSHLLSQTHTLYYMDCYSI